MQELLNYLPNEQKKELMKLFILRISSRVLVLMVIIILLFTGAMFGIHYLIQQDISNVKQQQAENKVSIHGSEDVSLEQAIIELNNTTDRLKTIQLSYIPWSKKLQQFSDIIVPGIHLEHISFNAENSIAQLQGKADTRDDYFAFQNALEFCDCIASSKLPLSLLKTDIVFSVDITLSESFFLDEK